MSKHPNAIPILPVHDMETAVAFWSRLPSLTVDQYEGSGYAFVLHGGAEVAHLALFSDLDVTRNRAGCYIHLPDIDERYAECVDAGLPVAEIRDEPWGMREFRLTDPSGNVLRIGWAR